MTSKPNHILLLKILSIGCVLFFLGRELTFAQSTQFQFEKLTIEQGLSQNTVFCIVQDNKGFMWFGTQDGLNRFDGYSFTVYRNDPTDTTTLSDNHINCMLVDRTGTLWVGTRSGLNRFNAYNETFMRYKASVGNAKSLNGNNITSICNDRSGTMWIGTNGGLCRFNPEMNSFTSYAYDSNKTNGISQGVVRSVVCDSSGFLWIGVDENSVHRFDPKHNDWKLFSIPKKATDDRSGIIIKAMFIDASGALWIGNDNGLYFFRTDNSSFIRYCNAPNDHTNLNINSISSIYEYNADTLWLTGSSRGFQIFNRRTHQFSFIHSDPLNSQGLSTNYLSSIYCDRTGNVWIGTSGGGINKLDKHKLKFLKYKIDQKAAEGYPINYVNAIHETRFGDLLVGCRGGVAIFDKEHRIKNIFQPGDKNNSFGLTNHSIRSIIEDQNGIIWIGGGGSGLYKYDNRTGRFQNFRNDLTPARATSANFIFSMIEDKNNFLWLGLGTGLHYFDRAKNKFVLWITPDSKKPMNNGVWSLFEDSRGWLWIGTSSEGVLVLDDRREFVTKYSHDPQNNHSLSENSVLAFCEDHLGTIWIATGNGLNKLDPTTGAITVYTTRNGLPNNMIYAVLEDDKHNLWMSTNKGISEFNPVTESFRNFDLQDGLQSNEYNQGSFCKSKDGEILFGGVNGFNSFFPSEIENNSSIPPVVITGFKIFDKPVLFDRHISDMKEITLSYQQNAFSFDFVALNYSFPAKNQYAYKLEGYDDDWIFCGTKRSVSYMNLEGGTYNFRIKGSNNDGVWNQEGASIRIIVIPPPWKTWWAYILYVLILVVVVYAIIQFRVRRALVVERVRSRIAADLHDEIGSSLTKISLHAELIQQGVSPINMENYLKKISDTSKHVVSTMSDIVWSIDARNDSIGSMIDRMRDFTASIFSDGHVEVVFEVSGLDATRKLPVDTRQNIYLIFKEALNNIIKHVNAKNVTISLTNAEHTFKMEIQNDGTSKSSTPNRSGHGLRNMTMRAKRIGGQLEIDFEKGGRVVLTSKAL